MAKKVINQRAKGQRGEREFADLMRGWFPNVKRGLQTRAGGNEADVEGTPWWLECKFLKRHFCLNHIRQADKAVNDHVSEGGVFRPPVVAIRESKDTSWYLLMRLMDFPGVAADALGAFLPDTDKKVLQDLANHLVSKLVERATERGKNGGNQIDS